MPKLLKQRQLISKEADISWLAGFFDGEGSISLLYYPPPSLSGWIGRVNLVQKDTEPLERVLDILASHNLPLPGCISNGDGTIHFNWSGAEAVPLLETLLPYFCVWNKKRAEIFIRVFTREYAARTPLSAEEKLHRFKCLQEFQEAQRERKENFVSTSTEQSTEELRFYLERLKDASTP